MRKIKSIIVAGCFVAAVSLTGISSVSAQGNSEHVYHLNISYMAAHLDSAQMAERNAIFKEYHDKVTMKNEFVLHVYTMTHYFSEDSREFITVYEYASWADIDKGLARDEELAKMAWPNEEKRNAFMKKMNGYFSSHKDGVYHTMPSLMK